MVSPGIKWVLQIPQFALWQGWQLGGGRDDKGWELLVGTDELDEGEERFREEERASVLECEDLGFVLINKFCKLGVRRYATRGLAGNTSDMRSDLASIPALLACRAWRLGICG